MFLVNWPKSYDAGVLAVVAVMLLWLAAMVYCIYRSVKALKAKKGREDALVMLGVLTIFSGIVGFFAAVLPYDPTSHTERAAVPAEIAALYGLQDGQAYPLNPGARVDSGSFQLNAVVFGRYANASASQNPDPAFFVNFVAPGHGPVPLLVSTGSEFRIVGKAEPETITFHFQPDAPTDSTRVYNYSPCRKRLHDLWFARCDHHLVETHVELGDVEQKHGLSGLMSDPNTLGRTTMVLHQDTYARIFGFDGVVPQPQTSTAHN
jgi:hypothetical protein